MHRIILPFLLALPAFAQPGRPFASFVGICQGNPSPDQPQWAHVGWCRHDFGWQQMQPGGPDSWNEEYLAKWQRLILANREQGVETLPVFCYTAVWAARRDAWSFTVGRKRYDVAAFTEGDPKQRTATETDLDTGATQPKTFPASRVPPQDVGQWERFVDRVVAELAKPPYNLTYFQVWNEANDSFTGFWVGGLDEYFATVHLPAARVIRQHGGKVVYGGYPCNGSVPHYLAALDRNRAWETLDVLDLHYFGIAAWDQIYQRLQQDGRDLGIWQTEVGFTRSREWVPNNYPRFFHWALTHGWRQDRYKIFQFANWTPDDPKSYGYDKCFLHGKQLSFHGQAFMALASQLDVAGTASHPRRQGGKLRGLRRCRPHCGGLAPSRQGRARDGPARPAGRAQPGPRSSAGGYLWRDHPPPRHGHG